MYAWHFLDRAPQGDGPPYLFQHAVLDRGWEFGIAVAEPAEGTVLLEGEATQVTDILLVRMLPGKPVGRRREGGEAALLVSDDRAGDEIAKALRTRSCKYRRKTHEIHARQHVGHPKQIAP